MTTMFPGIPVCEIDLKEHGSCERKVDLKVQLTPNVVVDGKILHCMPLIAQSSDKKLEIIKGNRYYLKNWEIVDGKWNFNLIDDLFLVGESSASTSGDILSIPGDKFVELLTLAFCTTVHKAQGITIKEPYKIHEVKDFTWRMAYVALSRTTSPDHIFIE
eukprot:Lithocolla_globosa_v1_NODE_1114_length_2859_cov_12.203281.p3 type:complete len:160 gc:universal NODE_1114_length_2859_cov_12.203281:2774-2295(-)